VLKLALSPKLDRVHARVEGRAGTPVAEKTVGPQGAALSVCGSVGVLVLTGQAGYGAVTLDLTHVPN
jgi:hypothetical protein